MRPETIELINKLNSELVDRIKQAYKEARIEAYKEAIKECFAEAVIDIEKIYNSVCDTFYGEYEPVMYKRNKNGLKDLLKITLSKDGGTLDIEFNSDWMGWHRVDDVDGDYIFNYVFLQGWHGGARGRGKGMGIPVPTIGEKRFYDGDKSPFSDNIPYRYIQASKSKSPSDMFDEEFELYKDTLAQKIRDKAAQKIKNIKITI